MLALPGTLRSQRPPSPRSRISGCRANLFRSCVGIGTGPGAQAPVAVARSTHRLARVRPLSDKNV